MLRVKYCLTVNELDGMESSVSSTGYDGLLPRYLSFIVGVVDSDSLPLNVNREQLQQNKLLTIMKKKIARKVLDMLKKLASSSLDDGDENENDSCHTFSSTSTDDDDDSAGEEGEGEKTCIKTKYQHFWDQFGTSMKYGILEDQANRKRLMPLLRFKSTKSQDSPISLDEYVSRMKVGQKDIYYIIGSSSVSEMMQSPSLEKLLAMDYEVLLMDSTMDEYVMMHATEYSTDVVNVNNAPSEGEDGEEEIEETTYSFKNVNSDTLSFGKNDKNKDAKKIQKHYTKKFKLFTKWMRDVIKQNTSVSTNALSGNGQLSEVKVSNRLESSPAVVVSGKYGYSANMERIINAQVGNNAQGKGVQQFSERTLEINPRHPIVVSLKEKYEAALEEQGDKEIYDEDMDKILLLDDDSPLISMVMTIYESALLESGFGIDVKDFNKNVYRLLRQTMDVPDDMSLVPEDDIGAEEEADSEAVSDDDDVDADGFPSFSVEDMLAGEEMDDRYEEEEEEEEEEIDFEKLNLEKIEL